MDVDPVQPRLFNQPLFPDPIIPQRSLITPLLVRPPAHPGSSTRLEVCKHIIRYIALLISVLLAATVHVLFLQQTPDDPEPYHMLVLTGQEWVMESIVGHPEHICCELGVYMHVFESLINDLHSLGHTDSCYVSLEEQLAIFLYTCVTGLTVRHVAERFQQSNDTISRYFRKMLDIFASHPFYTMY